MNYLNPVYKYLYPDCEEKEIKTLLDDIEKSLDDIKDDVNIDALIETRVKDMYKELDDIKDIYYKREYRNYKKYITKNKFFQNFVLPSKIKLLDILDTHTREFDYKQNIRVDDQAEEKNINNINEVFYSRGMYPLINSLLNKLNYSNCFIF